MELYNTWPTDLMALKFGSPYRPASCRQAVNNTMQKFGLKTTKSKRARREAEAEEEAEAALQFKVGLAGFVTLGSVNPKVAVPTSDLVLLRYATQGLQTTCSSGACFASACALCNACMKQSRVPLCMLSAAWHKSQWSSCCWLLV